MRSYPVVAGKPGGGRVPATRPRLDRSAPGTAGRAQLSGVVDVRHPDRPAHVLAAGLRAVRLLPPSAPYAASPGLAIWDLARRKATPGFTPGWIAAILLIPFVGVIAYLLFGRSRMIPAWLRFTPVGGGVAAYLAILGISAAVGGPV